MVATPLWYNSVRPCSRCARPAHHRCKRCRLAFYCGSECQRLHWSGMHLAKKDRNHAHRHHCFPHAFTSSAMNMGIGVESNDKPPSADFFDADMVARAYCINDIGESVDSDISESQHSTIVEFEAAAERSSQWMTNVVGHLTVSDTLQILKSGNGAAMLRDLGSLAAAWGTIVGTNGSAGNTAAVPAYQFNTTIFSRVLCDQQKMFGQLVSLSQSMVDALRDHTSLFDMVTNFGGIWSYMKPGLEAVQTVFESCVRLVGTLLPVAVLRFYRRLVDVVRHFLMTLLVKVRSAVNFLSLLVQTAVDAFYESEDGDLARLVTQLSLFAVSAEYQARPLHDLLDGPTIVHGMQMLVRKGAQLLNAVSSVPTRLRSFLAHLRGLPWITPVFDVIGASITSGTSALGELLTTASRLLLLELSESTTDTITSIRNLNGQLLVRGIYHELIKHLIKYGTTVAYNATWHLLDEAKKTRTDVSEASQVETRVSNLVHAFYARDTKPLSRPVTEDTVPETTASALSSQLVVALESLQTFYRFAGPRGYDTRTKRGESSSVERIARLLASAKEEPPFYAYGDTIRQFVTDTRRQKTVRKDLGPRLWLVCGHLSVLLTATTDQERRAALDALSADKDASMAFKHLTGERDPVAALYRPLVLQREMESAIFEGYLDIAMMMIDLIYEDDTSEIAQPGSARASVEAAFETYLVGVFIEPADIEEKDIKTAVGRILLRIRQGNVTSIKQLQSARNFITEILESTPRIEALQDNPDVMRVLGQPGVAPSLPTRDEDDNENEYDRRAVLRERTAHRAGVIQALSRLREDLELLHSVTESQLHVGLIGEEVIREREEQGSIWLNARLIFIGIAILLLIVGAGVFLSMGAPMFVRSSNQRHVDTCIASGRCNSLTTEQKSVMKHLTRVEYTDVRMGVKPASVTSSHLQRALPSTARFSDRLASYPELPDQDELVDERKKSIPPHHDEEDSFSDLIQHAQIRLDADIIGRTLTGTFNAITTAVPVPGKLVAMSLGSETIIDGEVSFYDKELISDLDTLADRFATVIDRESGTLLVLKRNVALGRITLDRNIIVPIDRLVSEIIGDGRGTQGWLSRGMDYNKIAEKEPSYFATDFTRKRHSVANAVVRYRSFLNALEVANIMEPVSSQEEARSRLDDFLYVAPQSQTLRNAYEELRKAYDETDAWHKLQNDVSHKLTDEEIYNLSRVLMTGFFEDVEEIMNHGKSVMSEFRDEYTQRTVQSALGQSEALVIRNAPSKSVVSAFGSMLSLDLSATRDFAVEKITRAMAGDIAYNALDNYNEFINQRGRDALAALVETYGGQAMMSFVYGGFLFMSWRGYELNRRAITKTNIALDALGAVMGPSAIYYLLGAFFASSVDEKLWWGVGIFGGYGSMIAITAYRIVLTGSELLVPGMKIGVTGLSQLAQGSGEIIERVTQRTGQQVATIKRASRQLENFLSNAARTSVQKDRIMTQLRLLGIEGKAQMQKVIESGPSVWARLLSTNLVSQSSPSKSSPSRASDLQKQPTMRSRSRNPRAEARRRRMPTVENVD